MNKCNKRCERRLRGKKGTKKTRAVLSNIVETTSVFVVEAYNEAPPKGEVAVSTVGGMAGAYIGSFGGPWGTAIGGFLGGVGGAMGGGAGLKKLFGYKKT